jgi:uncharacterized protein (TIGR00251 family)
MTPFSWRDNHTLLCRLRIMPRSGRSGFDGLVGDRFRVRIRSAPVEGQANDALITFLARTFRTSKSRVNIVSGRSQRDKLVEIDRPTRIPEEIVRQIDSTGLL